MTATNLLAEILTGCEPLTDTRIETLIRAIELDACRETLFALRDAVRVSRKATILLPQHRFEGLSRGRGWCRRIGSEPTEWGVRFGDQYRVETAGCWSVGATDGFSRKGAHEWTVAHLRCGEETWTIAS
jgi:hypothetical protein